jgi:hypothetical protein
LPDLENTVSAVVRKLTTDDDILAARHVMRQLRPQISEGRAAHAVTASC